MVQNVVFVADDDQSIKTNLYSALRRRRIRGACWTRLGRVFTFAVRTIKHDAEQTLVGGSAVLQTSRDPPGRSCSAHCDGWTLLRAVARTHW